MTLQDITKSAFQDLNIVDAGAGASTDEYADALVTANLITDDWNGQPDATPKQVFNAFLLNAASSYTLGPSGAWSYPSRPTLITGAAAINQSGIQKPVRIAATAAEFADVENQRVIAANWPTVIYCDYAFPNATVQVAPTSSGLMYLTMLVPEFPTFAAITDVLALPHGYTNMLQLELAVRLAPKFGLSVPAAVAERYGAARASIGARAQAQRGVTPPPPAA
jgi:hypothetical protein